jgi:hypothetical protein
MKCTWWLFASVLGLVVLINGCSKPPSHADLTWIEDVRLASGEIVSVKRHVVMTHTRALGGGFSSAKVFTTSSIEPTNSNEFSKWDAPFVPIVLDKDPTNGEWILVAANDGCLPWLRNGLPRPPYWAFRHRNGKWYRDVIPDSFLMREASLLVEFDVDDNPQRQARDIEGRKNLQSSQPKHPPQYGRIDSNFAGFEGCGRDQPSRPIGVDELDLSGFGRLR